MFETKDSFKTVHNASKKQDSMLVNAHVDRCPKPCDAVCTPYRRSNTLMCVSQLHPYTPFSAAAKITNTW